MKIIVDAMGGDNAPMEIVKGAIQALEDPGTEVMLVGNTEAILRCVQELGHNNLPKGLEIANASDVVTMEDDPARAVRDKRDSSMAVMLYKLRDGEGDAAVSAGSTGALLSGATLVVKRVRGVRRAALAPILPSGDGGCILIDCGANAECSPEYLQQFAYMGSVLARSYLGKEKPRVGLLNIGAEAGKGTSLQKDTYRLLEQAGETGKLNFIGNVEGRDVFEGVTDVLVTDGFSGNVLLKTVEGTAMYITGELKSMFLGSLKTKLAALMVKKDFQGFKKKLDYREVGGTVFLGITKPVVKAHGSCDARAMKNAIAQAMKLASSDMAKDLAEKLADLPALETEPAHE
jgi:glycerol-3-phosphate acyltransferase PlsX